PLLRMRRIPAHLAGAVIPMNRALVADNLAAAAIGALDIVEMNFADGAVLKAQKDRRRVFGIDFEPAELAGKADYVHNFTDQPADIIDLVNRIQDDTTAELAACAVAPAI